LVKQLTTMDVADQTGRIQTSVDVIAERVEKLFLNFLEE